MLMHLFCVCVCVVVSDRCVSNSAPESRRNPDCRKDPQ